MECSLCTILRGCNWLAQSRLHQHRVTDKFTFCRVRNRRKCADTWCWRCADVMREVAILHMLRAHPNVPTCYACYETGRYYVLVLDPCTAGELLLNVARSGLVAEAHIAVIMQQVLSVLAACHDVGIAHRCGLAPKRQLCGCVVACLP